jgi:hypothetical protein
MDSISSLFQCTLQVAERERPEDDESGVVLDAVLNAQTDREAGVPTKPGDLAFREHPAHKTATEAQLVISHLESGEGPRRVEQADSCAGVKVVMGGERLFGPNAKDELPPPRKQGRQTCRETLEHRVAGGRLAPSGSLAHALSLLLWLCWYGVCCFLSDG